MAFGWGKKVAHLCNPVCPFEIFLECLVLQADYEEQLVVLFCQYQAFFQLLAMTKMLNYEKWASCGMLQTFTYRSKAELGSHLSSSELDLIFSRAVLAAIVALIGFHCSVRTYNLEQLNGMSLFSRITYTV